MQYMLRFVRNTLGIKIRDELHTLSGVCLQSMIRKPKTYAQKIKTCSQIVSINPHLFDYKLSEIATSQFQRIYLLLILWC